MSAPIPLLTLRTDEEPRYVIGGTFRPTLVLGLGGTGTYIARRLKGLVAERYGTEMHLIRYLCIDTDSKSFGAVADLPALHEPERCDIGLSPERAQQFMRAMRSRGHHTETREWVTPDLDVSEIKGAGAGTVRACARLCLFEKFTKVRLALETACADLTKLPETLRGLLAQVREDITVEPNPLIYIVASCCGGTGAGLLMDVAVLLRRCLGVQQPDIVPFVAMPSVFRREQTTVQLRQRHQANTAASLLELQYFMDEREMLRGEWAFAYPDLGDLRPTAPVFTQCFLVEAKNELGQDLGSKEQVYELVARALLQEVSPIGADVRSRQVDLPAAGLEVCAETGRRRMFHSFAVTSLVIPAPQLLSYCCFTHAIAMLDQLGGGGTQDALTGVRQFLEEAHLNEFGNADQVLTALLTDTSSDPARVLDGHEFQMTDADLNQKEAPESIEDRRLEQAKAFVRDVVTPCVQANGQVMQATGSNGVTAAMQQAGIDSKPDQTRSAVAQVVAQYGVQQAAAWLVQLSKDLGAMAKEMCDESSQWKASSVGLRLKAGRDRARSWFQSHRGEQQMKDAHNEIVKQMVLEPARTEAARLLAELAGQVSPGGELATSLSAASTRLAQAREALVAGRSQAEASLKDSASAHDRFILQRRAMGLAQVSDFYESHKGTVSASDALHQWVSTVQAKGGLLDYLSSGAPDLGTELAEHCRAIFEPHVRETNVVRVLAQAQTDTDHVAYVEAQLEVLFGYCRPFWNMEQKTGQRFVESVLVGVPLERTTAGEPPAGDATTDTVNQWITQKTGAGQAAPEPRPTGFPFSLEMARRVYGARPYYHREWDEWWRAYQHLRADTRKPVHIHREFAARLPYMEPILDADVAFALAIALGFIARRGGRYAYAIEETPRGGLTPRFRSDLPIVWFDRTRLRLSSMPDRLPSGDQLGRRGEGREAARRIFCAQTNRCEDVRAAVDRLVGDSYGRYADALRQQVGHLQKLASAAERTDVSAGRPLRFEIDCIEKEFARVTALVSA